MAKVNSAGTSGGWYVGHCALVSKANLCPGGSSELGKTAIFKGRIKQQKTTSRRLGFERGVESKSLRGKLSKRSRMCTQKCVQGSFLTREDSTVQGGISLLESRLRTAKCLFFFSTYWHHFQSPQPNSNIIHLKSPETLSWLSTKWIIPSSALFQDLLKLPSVELIILI